MLLLTQVYQAAALPWLRGLSAVEVLRRVSGNLPPSERMISSPYDTEARYGAQRAMSWVGYKVHLTETCAPGGPHLITHVETTLATQPTVEAVEAIHQGLAEHHLRWPPK